MGLQTTAVVVTYNRCQMLEKCINSLLRQSVPCDILVVDNHSTDRTREVTASFGDPRITYFDTGKNLGGAGGFYTGVKIAAQKNYRFLWLMDDDTIPAENALEKLLQSAENQKSAWGWLAGKVLWKDDSICLMNLQRPTPFTKISSWEKSPIPCQMASFVSLLLNTEAVKTCGLPVKDFFIWGDDWEYTRRISRKYPCFTIPESVAIHQMAENTPNNLANVKAERIDRFFYLYRNEWCTFRREFPLGWFYYSAKCTWNFWKILLFAPSQKLRRCKILVTGMLKGLTFFPEIEFLPKDS